MGGGDEWELFVRFVQKSGRMVFFSKDGHLKHVEVLESASSNFCCGLSCGVFEKSLVFPSWVRGRGSGGVGNDK